MVFDENVEDKTIIDYKLR